MAINRSLQLIDTDFSGKQMDVIEREGEFQLIARDDASEEVVTITISHEDAQQLADWMLVIVNED